MNYHKWIIFYNQELADDLNNYLFYRVLVVAEYHTFQKYWNRAQRETKLSITPKDLRTWFCVEMTNLGVPDKYIDAYCGRTPKSVLARHYTDYSPRRLKSIYDKAGLTILS